MKPRIQPIRHETDAERLLLRAQAEEAKARTIAELAAAYTSMREHPGGVSIGLDIKRKIELLLK